ncbi:ABC transporter-related protein [Pyrolobus fumarii 1A]|uniref:ABC transporter-related protein n=1 Tax=Pyrolobus fumarii (strain DSM 11204 / 1A) TaxID=694429 RepID=G0EGX1_PYRF1|nr:ABC transporter-related protein [Pyrolobus fumarii 1A]
MARGEAVVAESLSKRYPNGVWGAREVSFRASYGRVTVVLGPNGAGKTTTVKMLATLLRPTGGRGLVAGFDVVREAWEVRRRIALVPQEASIDPNLTPMEAVKWYLVARGWSVSDAYARAREVLEELGLWDVRDRPGWHLSGGQKRKVVTAMALATGAEVVFLDEPSTGLDVESKYSVWGIVRRYASSGSAVLLTTHDMREAEALADHLVLISEGRVAAEGPPQELRSSIPYRYRVVLRRPRRVEWSGPRLEIGDMLVLYARDRGEASEIASRVDAESVTIEEVGLEDVYLYHTRGGAR